MCRVRAAGFTALTHVTCTIRPGHLLCIMGPSGSGKTTFMNVAMGKVPHTAGRVLVNGAESSLTLVRSRCGYVPQEDTMLRALTVYDNLFFSARTRLPARVDAGAVAIETAAFLGLGHVLKSPIGSEESRGISGGQRKRVNIGMVRVCLCLCVARAPRTNWFTKNVTRVCVRARAGARRVAGVPRAGRAHKRGAWAFVRLHL